MTRVAKHDRFARGSGCYTCQTCGRRTRETGDGANVKLCEPCYDLAGWQNSISDNGPDPQYLEVCRDRARTVYARGGRLDWADAFWAERGDAYDGIHEMALAEDAARRRR